MKLQLLTRLEQITACQSTWNQVAGSRPFFRWEWLANWLIAKIEMVSPAVLVGIDDQGNWLGIAPFCIETKSVSKKLRFLGSGSVCSDYMNLFSLPGHEREFAASIADWLKSNLHSSGPLGSIDVIELEGVDLTDESVTYFFDLMKAWGFTHHTSEMEGCWVMQLPSTWDEVNQSITQSLRRKTKKAIQRLRDAETSIRSTDQHPLDELWPTFVELHQKRRQMLDQPGCFADPKFEAFLYRSAQQLISVGRAELIVIDYQQQPIASYLLLNDGQTAMFYQSGIDPERLSLEPGHQIAVSSVQRSIEKGFQYLDFLRGDEPYKSRWLTTRTPLTRIKLVPRNLSSQLKHSIWQTGYSLKQYLKSSK